MIFFVFLPELPSECININCPLQEEIDCASQHIPSITDQLNDDIPILRQERSLQPFKRRESIKIIPVYNYIHKRSLPEDILSKEIEQIELISKCCPKNKCKDCSKIQCLIPKCESDQLPISITTENKTTECCPIYICDTIPDCSNKTDNFKWLQPCRSCNCNQNETVCYETCTNEDNHLEDHQVYCFSNKNRYTHGQIWKKNDCTNCECIHGEEKCQSSVCKPQHCTKTIIHPGECCPVCDTELNDFCSGHENCDIACQFGYNKSQEFDCYFCKCSVKPTEVFLEHPCAHEDNNIIKQLNETIEFRNIVIGILGSLLLICMIAVAFFAFKYYRSHKIYKSVGSIDSNPK